MDTEPNPNARRAADAMRTARCEMDRLSQACEDGASLSEIATLADVTYLAVGLLAALARAAPRP